MKRVKKQLPPSTWLEVAWKSKCCYPVAKGHWHLLNNHNTSPSRQMIILFWNRTILYKTEAKRFVCYTMLFHHCWYHYCPWATAGTKNWQQTSCVHSWTAPEVRQLLPAKQTERLFLCAFKIRPLKHVLAWNSSVKKENETTVKNKPSSTVSHRFYSVPL